VAKFISISLGGLVTVALMVTALWAWRFAPELAMQHSDRPYLAKVGIRSLALAVAAAAQVALLTFVVARFYPPGLPERLLSVAIGVGSSAALAVAIVLAVASR
jgi:hypothetical protein